MKILHISYTRKLTNGQRLQLKAEFDSVKNIDNVKWDVLAFHTGELKYNFEKKIPNFFSGIILRKLYAWSILLRLHKKYDIVLERKVPFDPFNIFFGWFVHNRYTVHHAKEIGELKILNQGVLGIFAAYFEVFSGKINAKQILGYIGVTKEIAQYENSINNTLLPELFYPNGINMNTISLTEDKREKNINGVFMCGSFNEWHGLDLLLEAISNNMRIVIEKRLTIHLVGILNKEQLVEVAKINLNNNIFFIYGHLDFNEYKYILSKCDFGIGSLAMFRQELNEGSTLKVREYLAYGLPVYSGHKDTSLPIDFPFYLHEDNVNINSIIDFGYEMRNFTRNEIRKKSIPYIDKENLMKNLIYKLRELRK